MVTAMPKAKFSERFGQIIDGLLSRYGLSQAEAHVRSKGRISKTYWGNLRLGFVPSYDKVLAVAETFPDEDLTELFESAGFTPPAERAGSLAELPPGARLLRYRTEGMPLGVPVPASEFGGEGERFEDDGVDTTELVRALGALYALEVAGDCLAPKIERGDLVYVRPIQEAGVGDVVVVRHESAYTLKVWRRKDGVPWFGTADEERFPGFYPSPGDRVVGVVVGVTKLGAPSFR